jgi:GT2 family glycosyltransferase
MSGSLRLDPEALQSARKTASPLAVDVSVVMVVFMTGPALFKSIDHVLADPRVGEFVIIDNGSTPDDAEKLRAIAEDEPRVKLLAGHGNVGFARGANMGAAAATGRRLMFLNPDAYLQPGCIQAMETALRNSPRRPCIIGARVLNEDRSEQRGARRGEVTLFTSLLTFTRLTERVQALHRYEVHHEADPVPGAPVEVSTISGACFFTPREDFAAVGGFDTGFFLHVEDVDLCWRVRERGGSVLFHPGAEVVHLGHTSRISPLFVEFWKGVGLARYFRKRADTPRRRAMALVMSPLVIGVSVIRPALRRLNRR